MKRTILSLLLIAVLAGCSRAAPRAVTSEAAYDFGDVPVAIDMTQTRLKEFVIMNDGTADLRLTGIDVQVLEGC